MACACCGRGREDVQVVAENTKREDGYGEAIAAQTTIAAKELGDDFVVVFCASLTHAGAIASGGLVVVVLSSRTLLGSDARDTN